ncbi:hypothetical protein PTI98_012258 [Pleurotus ostreatus]|uniref:Ribonuclease H1 N-terminal domain-containing protein n=1 Tax=Pleurotus ostreatus (strain PC15) TaxID=1137138 RepID=A0A067N6W5_PLEO1|nr:hypothetical protein PTI98_012258 [Pleurotus ostreatus]KDQ23599.1 hypothetical protein PLEOSDRAFT_1086094 [Pleurotus ostreatus PC15]
MQVNYSVAELSTLFSQHGIAVPAALQAKFDDALSDQVAVATAPASPTDAAAVEIEPEETVIGGDGSIRCPNCNTHLALFAVTRATNVPAVPAANVAPAADAANAVPAADDAPVALPATTVLPPPVASNSRSSRWYAVTVGRQTGVFYAKWDEQINDLVSGVPFWNAPRFATEGEARTYFAHQAAAGKVHVHTSP